MSTRHPYAKHSTECCRELLVTFDRLETDRLVLRRWTDTDRTAFHAMNSDPAVMATLGPVMRRSESDAFMNRINEAFDLMHKGESIRSVVVY